MPSRRGTPRPFSRRCLAGFETQAPHLRRLLEHLPLLEPQEAAVQTALGRGGRKMNLSEVLTCLQETWMGHHPPNSHEGAVQLALAPEQVRLVFTFEAYVWGQTSVIRRYEIARVGEALFVYQGLLSAHFVL